MHILSDVIIYGAQKARLHKYKPRHKQPPLGNGTALDNARTTCFTRKMSSLQRSYLVRNLNLLLTGTTLQFAQVGAALAGPLAMYIYVL